MVTGLRNPPPATLLQEPFAWQAKALGSWRGANSRGVIEAVTGTGKSWLGARAIAEAQAEGRRAAVLVRTNELQAADS